MSLDEGETLSSGSPPCEHCHIRHRAVFSCLDRADFALIREPIDEQRYVKGQVLYRLGQPAKHLFTVREGIVKLVRYSDDGNERIVRLLVQGDVAGLEALIGQPYHHYAVPLNPLLTCRIPVSVISQLSLRLPKFHHELLTRWQKSVEDADAWLTDLVTGPVKSRLARLLIRLTETGSGPSYFLPTREDIGAILSVTTESVSRTTANFKRSGLIEYVGPQRVHVNLEGLRQIVNVP